MGKTKSEKAEKIREIIKTVPCLLEIVYNKKRGDVEVFYNPEDMTREYHLFFNGTTTKVDSLDEAMTTPFIEGNSLSDIANKVKIYNGEERLI